MAEGSRGARPHRITLAFTVEEFAEVRALAARERATVSAVIRMAARDATGRPAKPQKPGAWDEGYDHALQQELSVLNLIAIEQVLQLLKLVAPYGAGSDDVLVAAAQAAQRRLARGIPDALGGRSAGDAGE